MLNQLLSVDVFLIAVNETRESVIESLDLGFLPALHFLFFLASHLVASLRFLAAMGVAGDMHL
jgi:hypothetical protein